MYKLQNNPAEKAVLRGGGELTPLATLRDEHGGVFHIIKDDHCLVLVKENPEGCIMAKHWFPEAVKAMKSLPTPEYV